MEIKDLIIKNLATRIANDAIQQAHAQAQIELAKHEKGVEANAESRGLSRILKEETNSTAITETTSHSNKAL